MRRVALRESHPPYTVTIGEEILSQEPLILERDGEPVAIVIPLAEYQAFRAWQEAQQQGGRKPREDGTFLPGLEAIRQRLQGSGYRRRTKEEVDAQIEAERESWGL